MTEEEIHKFSEECTERRAMIETKGIIKQYIDHDYSDGSKPEPITECCRHLMGNTEMGSLKRMKNQVKMYRGCSIDEIDTGFGQSWTLSKSTAKRFAFTIEGHSKHDSVVFEATIDKENIFAYVNDRRERECIVNVDKLTDIRQSSVRSWNR